MVKKRELLSKKELMAVEAVEHKWSDLTFLRLEAGYDDGSVCFVFKVSGDEEIDHFDLYGKIIPVIGDIYGMSFEKPFIVSVE